MIKDFSNKIKNNNDKDEINKKIEKQRINIANKLMNIIDEDGQPLYNNEWIEKNILK